MLKIIRLLFLPLAIIFIGATFTGAYFSSDVALSGMSFSTGTWYTGPGQGDVAINELMWMGSVGESADEWIELRNTTGNAIDISGWKITKVNSIGVESQMLSISSGSIPANGYYIISNYDKATSAINVEPNLVTTSVDLSNANLKIRLYKGDWTNLANLIDTAGNGGAPLAGTNGTQKQSMSRKTAPGDGWYTDTTSNSLIYWDSVDANYGTPGGTNGI